jgi:hypothetical protein
MANFNDLFVAERGLSIDGIVSFIYGAGRPGNTEDTDNAGVGSLYSQTDSGGIWKKIESGAGADSWAELINHELPVSITGVSVPSIIDQVPTEEANYYVWAISGSVDSDPTRRMNCILSASNDATAEDDATTVMYETHSVLKSGDVAGIKASVVLGTSGGKQTMALQVEAPVPTTFTAYRLLKNYVSTKMIAGVEVASAPVDPIDLLYSQSSYTYNGDGSINTVTQRINGNDLVETYAYNADGSISVLITTYKGRTRTETFSYDGNGSLLSSSSTIV